LDFVLLASVQRLPRFKNTLRKKKVVDELDEEKKKKKKTNKRKNTL
jgi:hypothetical protein